MDVINLLAELFFYVAVLATTIYTLIFGYHWFSYGTSQKLNLLMLAIFLIGAAVFLSITFISWQLFA